MKKHLGILCSLILVLSLAACGTDFDGSRTELKDYLQGLDLFIKIPSYTSLQKGERVQDLEIFLQPGMIYAHATALMQSLADNSVWMDSCGIDDRKAFLFRADRFVKGILCETNGSIPKFV